MYTCVELALCKFELTLIKCNVKSVNIGSIGTMLTWAHKTFNIILRKASWSGYDILNKTEQSEHTEPSNTPVSLSADYIAQENKHLMRLLK